MIISILNIIKKLFNKDKSATTIISSSSVFVLFLYFGLTIEEQENNPSDWEQIL